tara:strand:- start:264 stop:512 length:249 start_codon:yes stop_codon:yes gene_type:complete
MLARNLSSFEIKGIPVAIAGWISKFSHSVIVLDPTQLTIIGYIAPNEESTYAIPSRSFGPQGSDMMTLYWGVEKNIPLKTVI